MNKVLRRSLGAAFALALALVSFNVAGAMAGDAPKAAREEVSYTNDIRPLVNNFCATCHHGEDPSGDFVLDSYEDVLRIAKNGALLDRINDADDPMPPKGLLPKNMRRLFQKWVDGGCVNVGARPARGSKTKFKEFAPPKITPIDINKRGFEFLGKMQGHWVGSMKLMGEQFDWFALDYRAIAPSHVHGIFEGGTMGNLFTSFFVTDFHGKRTIMARNGGILNGIYRTSYFVLTEVQETPEQSEYRFVDAYGGKQIMWIDVAFAGDRIEFKAYTSRMGLLAPSEHLRFVGRRKHDELSRAAARAVGFPKNVIDRDLSGGLPKPNWGGGYEITSASYMWEEPGKSLVELGKLARDPYRIDQMPRLAQLQVSVERSPATRGKTLFMFLSQKALTHKSGQFIAEQGYVRADLLDTLLLFPEIAGNQDVFTFTYLHPGTYYLTVVADMDGDELPGPGDISNPRRKVIVKPKSVQTIRVTRLHFKN